MYLARCIVTVHVPFPLYCHGTYIPLVSSQYMYLSSCIVKIHVPFQLYHHSTCTLPVVSSQYMYPSRCIVTLRVPFPLYCHGTYIPLVPSQYMYLPSCIVIIHVPCPLYRHITCTLRVVLSHYIYPSRCIIAVHGHFPLYHHSTCTLTAVPTVQVARNGQRHGVGNSHRYVIGPKRMIHGFIDLFSADELRTDYHKYTQALYICTNVSLILTDKLQQYLSSVTDHWEYMQYISYYKEKI
jgi:hypothetical protein